ncbi:DUF1573 domain-containing protein [Dysgonomonas sp. Marseille-P4677]|uniref:DUF1573 domain-containing protein n=1 Tax=Dysgonomonas sp. Marseille-P4677 TaxID=2364790 RepID=UPI0019125B27|nr:DUF1573 domain-containing protein [Dysgonomonas sp. Marseille-P4677]MBK5722413.1 DUF1573 domain-containing protein [Dysgonomonas sp. Marseille-P4677]
MKIIKYTTFLILSIYVFTGCLDKRDKQTTLDIIDNNRHYYPIMQGEELNISFNIKNTGEVPFILEDIITSCGCITANKSGIDVIPPGKEGRLILQYDSNKNVGLSKHHITLYGNLRNMTSIDIAFDVHVVPDALYSKDYEELYQKEKGFGKDVKDLMDGKESDQGYYIENH